MNPRNILVIFLLFLTVNTKLSTSAIDYFENSQPIDQHILYTEILKTDIKFPDIVFAQAVLESGNFTSDVFLENKNLFGMKFPNRRQTLSVGKSDSGYAIYNKWKDSVYDYQLWQEFSIGCKEEMTINQYYTLLSRVYAEDRNYVNKIKDVLKMYNTMLYF